MVDLRATTTTAATITAARAEYYANDDIVTDAKADLLDLPRHHNRSIIVDAHAAQVKPKGR